MSTFEKVRDIVVEQLGVEPDEVAIDSTFIDDLGADSLDTVELVMAFEEEFNIEIPDDAAEKIQTVGDAVNFIKNNYLLGKRFPANQEAQAQAWENANPNGIAMIEK